MQIIRNKKILQEQCIALKQDRHRLGFVPTMGALHRGHLSLVETAKKHADIIIVSIFVNPAQFAAHEDFGTYPRTEDSDLKKLEQAGVDIVYIPSVEDIYPENFDLSISTGALGQDLDGRPRPHFFDGVALVVNKLFLQTQPDIAVFGEKDFQQLTIIRKLVEQLDIPVNIIGGATIREADGLACSSRNQYLDKQQREIAGQLNQQIQLCMTLLDDSQPVNQVAAIIEKNLLSLGFNQVDYIAIRDNATLKKISNIEKGRQYRILIAAVIGNTRLIDNMLYEPL